MQKIYTAKLLAKYNDTKTVLVSDYHLVRESRVKFTSLKAKYIFYDHITYPMPSSLTLLVLSYRHLKKKLKSGSCTSLEKKIIIIFIFF